MAGAGKNRTEQVSRSPALAAEESNGDARPGEAYVGGFDGPSDVRSNSGGQSHGFGPSLGYDPAQDRRAAHAERLMGSRFELPKEAYRDNSTGYEFPSNLPLRPKDMNTQGKAIQLRVNQFKVTHWPQKEVYQYDVLIGNGAEARGLVKAVWNSKSVQEKLHALDDKWLWDGNKIAWCSVKAPRDEMRMIVNLDEEKGRKPRIDRKTGQPADNSTRIVIKLTGKINMAVIKAYLDRDTPFDNTVLQSINFLDICMRQYPAETYTQIKRSFYSRGNGRQPLDECVEAMKGVYASMRLCQPIGSNGGGTGLAVNVDVANGTFWVAQGLHQATRNYCNDRNPLRNWATFRDLLCPVKDTNSKGGGLIMSRDFKELRKFVKVRFTVNYRGQKSEPKVHAIKGFAFDPERFDRQGAHAKAYKFLWRDKDAPASSAAGVEISVYDYFLKKYNIYLEHWYLPLVETEKNGVFPMEICNLLPNQKYRYKLTPDQTSKMIKFAVTRPKERIQAIRHGVEMLNWDEDPYLAKYGIKIDQNMTLTNARLLQNPEVQFGNAKVNPGTSGRWDLRGKKFLKTNPEPLKAWGVCVLENCVDSPTLQNFLKVFMATYAGHGGNIVNKTPFIHFAARNEDLSDAVTKTRQGTGNQSKMEPQIILYVLKDRNSFTYERLKKNMECRYGIVSQMMQVNNVVKAQPQYCSNVCMKLNAKLGGTTSRVAGKDAKTGPPFFTESTMVIGADVSHPSPGSPQPSMAALTMSMDKDACRFAAAVQTNGHRVEMITRANLGSMLIPLFDEWIKTVGGGRGPSHIYYFRDGVSEGQYMQVLDQEVADMKAAIREKYGAVQIKFTVTICSKRHHIRLLPKEGDSQAGDRNGNPHPGTLVERDVTHPFEYDFYLNSHSAIQGTARPVHYHVILDEANIPTNKFQAMIYQHCYQFMRSTTPVSLYPAVYYAHLASNRARAHEDVASSEGPRGGQKFVEEQAEAAVLAHHQARAGIIPKSKATSSRDKYIEARPLLELGGNAPPVYKQKLKVGMWYI